MNRWAVLFGFCFLSIIGVAQPAITSFSPANAVTGAVVTITGSGFNTNSSANIVYFGATKAVVNAASATELSVVVPVGASFAPITVLNAASGLLAYSAQSFLPTFAGAGAKASFVPTGIKDYSTVSNSIPIKAQLGDFDGDGKPDMAAVISNGKVAVFSNTSSIRKITFATPSFFGTGATPNDIAIADMNGDGKLDMVTVNSGDNTISVFINTSTTGSISFNPRQDFTTGASPGSIAIHDLDGDGRPDVVITNSVSNTISLFRNVTSGATFALAAKLDLAAGTSPNSVAITDIDGDRKPDIAVSNQVSNNVSIFYNTSFAGNFSFTTLSALTANAAIKVAFGDFNSNGKEDLLAISSGATTPTFFDNTSTTGNISFAGGIPGVTNFSNEISVVVHDFTGDGKPDIVTLNNNGGTGPGGPGYGAGIITTNTSSGSNISFGVETFTVSTGLSPVSISAGDIDGDGKPDLIIPSQSASITVYRNTTTSVPPVITSFAPLSAATGDILTITGSNFEDVFAVYLGNSVPNIQVLSSTTIRLTVGSNASSGALTVLGPGGSSGLGGFTFYPIPGITSFNPTSGSAGTVITITGTDFSNVTAVRIGGVDVASYSVVSTTTIRAIVGVGTSGVVNVISLGGLGFLSGFGSPAIPQISSFTPTAASSGQAITITGTNFINVTSITLGGAALASFNVLSSTTITGIIGSGSSGNLVVNATGGSNFSPGFTYVSTAPTITSFTPTSAGPGTSIIITGTNFNETTSVTLGGTAVAAFNAISPTQIIAVVNTGASGPLTVTNGNQSAGIAGFTYLGATTSISSFTPMSGPVGSTVTINGNNFSTNPTDNIVYFSGARAIVTSATPVQLKVTVPVGANYGPITVLNKFQYYAPYSAYSGSYFAPTFDSGGGSFSLTGATNIATGAGPYQVVLSDINDDGKLDMLVINKTDANVSVYKNTTVGKTISFDTRINYATGTMPQGLAVADVNNDGRQDIITANFGSNTISVLLNNGTGNSISFADKVDFSAGASGVGMQSLAVSDIDGDGRPDILVTNNLTHNISVYQNFSSGNTVAFARKEFPTVNYPIGLCVADLDGDGKPDIAVAGQNTTSMLRNTSTSGVISFAPKVEYTSSGIIASIGVIPTDQNGDGKIDLLVTKTGTNLADFLRNVGNAGYISFGSGIFSTSNTTPLYPYGYASSDLDGDGKLDIIYPNTGSSTIHFQKNRTTNPNTPNYLASTLTNLTSGLSIAIGDIDGDGKPDVVTCKGPDAAGITAYLNNTMPAPVISSVTPLTGTTGDVLTVTGSLFNGINDVKLGGTAAASFNVISSTLMTVTVGNGLSGSLSVTGAAGTGAFTGFIFVPPVTPPPTITSFTPTSGVRGTTISITGTNLTWTTDVTIGGNPANSFSVVSPTNVLAIVNSGGASGAISVTTASGTAGKDGFVFTPQPIVTSIYPNNGSATTVFTITGSNFVDVQKVEIGSTQVGAFKVVSPEIIVATVGNNMPNVGNSGGGSGGIKVTSATGSNQVLYNFYYILTQPMPPLISSVKPLQAKPGSLDTIRGLYLTNADISYGGVKAQLQSITDSLVIVKVPAYAPYDYVYASDRVSHLTGYSPQKFIPMFNGAVDIPANNFLERSNFATGSTVKDVLVTDFDGDGKPDVAAVGEGSTVVSVFRNTSSGDTIRFDLRKDLVSGNGASHIAYADFDGDGRQDLVAINKNETGNALVSVFRNTSAPGTISFTNKINLVVPTNMSDAFTVSAGDFNRDGKPDIFVMTSMGMVTFKNTSPQTDSVLFTAPTTVVIGLTNLTAFDLLHVADISADGAIDYIGASSWRPYVSAFRNNNNITSSSTMIQSDFATYSQPTWVTTGDVDNDGKNDIITASKSGNKISVLRNINTNINTPLFDTNIDFTTTASPTSVSLGDLNGDGKLDLIAPGLSESGMLLFTNIGIPGISFSGIRFISNVPNAYITASADLNGDGKPEIISGTTSGIAVFRNTIGAIVPPTITSFSPVSATTGDMITVTGSGFTGIADLTLGGTVVASYKVVSSTTMTIIVGSGSSGSLSITTAGGAAGLTGFTYLAPVKPTITSIEPAYAAAGMPVTITGANFKNVSSVLFGTGTNAVAFNVLSPTTITTLMPDRQPDSIYVVTPAGKAAGTVIYVPPPTITSFSPQTAKAGDTLVITGTNFWNMDVVKSVTLGITNVNSIVSASFDKIRAIVGTGATGNVSVTTIGGTGTLSGFTYSVNNKPSIVSFTPSTAGTGATITVTGANLSGVLSATLGGTAVASFKTISSTLATFIVGSGASGTLSLTTAFGSATVTGFIYMAPVTITSGGALCSGGTMTLTSSAPSGNQWYRNDQLITGATAATYVASTTGTYYSVATVEGVGYKSNILSIVYSPRPFAAFGTGSNTNQCLFGNVYNFNNVSTIAGTGASIVSRQWSFGDGQGSDLNNASHSYTIPGRYEVKLVVRSNEGCTDSMSLFYTVLTPPSLNVQNPAPVCSPAVVTITNAVTSPGFTLTYWRDSLATIALANPSALTSSGTYYIKGNDTSVCSAIRPVTVTINPLPTIAAIAGDASVCSNAKIVLTNTTAGGIWSSTNSGVLTIDALGTVTPVNAGTATVTYSYKNPTTGCTGAVSKLVTVNPLPVAGKPALLDYANDTLVCFLAGTTFSSKNTYDKYLWSTGETSSTIQVSNNTTVSLKVGSNLTPCYSESSAVITARKNLTPQPSITRQGDDLLSSSSSSYKWLFNNNFTGDTLNHVTINQRGIYNVSTSVDKVCWNTSNDYLVFLDPVVIKRAFEMIAYPNPTNGPFNLQLKFDRTTTAVIKITIVDQGGTTRWSGKKLIFMDKSIKIAINTSLAKGTYTVKADVNGEVNTQQLIVM